MKHRLPIVIAAAAALVAVGAAPALAATGGAQDTTATFTLSGGDLTLTTQANAALTNRASGSTDIQGNLGNVHVADARGSATTWSVSVSSTQFVGAGAHPSTSNSVSYRAGNMTLTGTSAIGVGSKNTVRVPVSGNAGVVMTPRMIRGVNTADWNPSIYVDMPTSALADTYSATFTTSIL